MVSTTARARLRPSGPRRQSSPRQSWGSTLQVGRSVDTVQDAPDVGRELGQILTAQVPRHPEIDPEVRMDQDVAGPRDVPLRDLRMPRPKRGWKTLDGFADDLEASDHKIRTTSRRIRFRDLGCSEPGVATSTSRPDASRRSSRRPAKSSSVRSSSNSTKKSRSLSAVASPRANDPNRPARTTPRHAIGTAAIRRMSSTEGSMRSRYALASGHATSASTHPRSVRWRWRTTRRRTPGDDHMASAESPRLGGGTPGSSAHRSCRSARRRADRRCGSPQPPS